MISELSVILALIMPLWAGTDYLYSLIDAVALRIGTRVGTLNFLDNILANHVLIDSYHFDIFQNDDSDKFIIDNHFMLLLGLPNRTSGMKFPVFQAPHQHPFLDDTGTSINESAADVLSQPWPVSTQPDIII
jgi:hypothetical protein